MINHNILDGQEAKLCSSCKEWKPLSNYNKDMGRRDGLSHRCKKCDKKRYIKYVANEEIRTKRSKTSCAWDKANRPKRRKSAQEWRDKNRDHRNNINRLWVAENREKVRKSNREFDSRRYATDKGRIDALIATGMRHCLKDGKNERHWEELVGYSWDRLKTRLIKTLPIGYTWEDFMVGDLHIDHIIPKRVFNYEKPEDIDFQRCWSLSNLQLLPAKENMSKSGKIAKPFQPSLTFPSYHKRYVDDNLLEAKNETK
jgi:hypothetical protein